MAAIATPSVKSIILTIDRPYEEDGVTPRDDLIGVKVWLSTVTGFNPLDVDGNQVVTPDYDGPSLNCVLGDLTAGTEYFIRYAMISEIDPTYLELSDQISATPVSAGGGGEGQSSIAVILSSESHNVPSSTSGVVSSYTGSGTDILVYEGTTPLTASTSGANGTFSVGTPVLDPAGAITPGAISYSGSYATVANHSAMSNSADVVSITYPITIKTAAGDTVTINKSQAITKSKAGSQGPSVVVNASRALSFTATDGTLDTQDPIALTAVTTGLVSPAFVWTFVGLQTNPAASTTASQSITAAQFGNSSSAIVTCKVTSAGVDYVSTITIVRLEKSTAAAGATNVYIDEDGAIQGVSEGAGTAVSNGNVTISKDGVLTGGGTSEQIDLTEIPGTLVASRLTTGTLGVNTKIVVGEELAGVVVDGSDSTVKVISYNPYQILVFRAGNLGTTIGTLPTNLSGLQAWMTAQNFKDYLTEDMLTVSGTARVFYVLKATVSPVGALTWASLALTEAGFVSGTRNGYYLFGISSNPKVPPTTWGNTPVAPTAGQYQWVSARNSLGQVIATNLVSNEAESRDSFSPIKIGKLTSTYGIEGRTNGSSGGVIFRLDTDGLYIKSGLPTLLALGISPRRVALTSDAIYAVTWPGPAAQGITTLYAYVDVLPNANSQMAVHEAVVIGVFHRMTIATGVAAVIEEVYKKFTVMVSAQQLGTAANPTYTVRLGGAPDAFQGSTNFPAANFTFIADADGTVSGTGVPGIYLKLIARNMLIETNTTSYDSCDISYATWRTI